MLVNKVNKHNESYLAGNKQLAEQEQAASKWTLEQLAKYLEDKVGRGLSWLEVESAPLG